MLPHSETQRSQPEPRGREESPDSKPFAFLHPAPLCLAACAWMCCLLSVHCSSSHLFPSITLLLGNHWPWRPGALVFWTCFHTFSLRWSERLSFACSCITSSKRYVDMRKPLYCDGPNQVPATDSSQLWPVSPVLVWPLIIKDHKRVAHLGREAQVQTPQFWK